MNAYSFSSVGDGATPATRGDGSQGWGEAGGSLIVIRIHTKFPCQVDLCFLEGGKMTSVRDLMVFLDHAKFSAPLFSLPTISAPKKPNIDVEAREFRQLPELKKGKVVVFVTHVLMCLPSGLSLFRSTGC